MWLDWSITTINATLQLLDIYIDCIDLVDVVLVGEGMVVVMWV